MIDASLDLLRRLATQPQLCCLWAHGSLHAQWGVAAQPIRGLDDLPELPGSLSDAHCGGWPGRIEGGALVQLDYELPVGIWAASGPVDDRPRGWAWPLVSGCRLAPGGELTLIGAGDSVAVASPMVELPAVSVDQPLTPAWDEAGHRERVAAIRAHIAAGDLYQANLTLPFDARLRPAAHLDLAIFSRLVRRSPAGYACLLRTPAGSIISHSPECFLVADGRSCRSAPIKGTRPRAPGQDELTRAELLGAEKDNAELAMIVDLVRNDLGRIARPGGVRLERSPHVVDLDYVHHLVAQVVADLGPGCRIADLLRAAFPAGSITGAPKIAAMELIRSLEVADRGPYCGSFGWVGTAPGGPLCSLSVAIRTMVLSDDGRLRAHAGGGIVADSDGAAEWREVLAKLRGMAASLEGA